MTNHIEALLRKRVLQAELDLGACKDPLERMRLVMFINHTETLANAWLRQQLAKAEDA